MRIEVLTALFEMKLATDARSLGRFNRVLLVTTRMIVDEAVSSGSLTSSKKNAKRVPRS